MKKFLAIVAVALFVGAPAFAANTATITYTLQLGGKNAAELGWTGDPATPPVFDTTGVVEAPGTYPTANDVVTWSVRVEVGGMYGPDGMETPVDGAANLVWDLKLHQGADTTGPLVAIAHGSPATAGFFSTVQNGTTMWGGNTLTEENAAFPWVFTGRIFDAAADALTPGVGMEQYTFPNTAGFQAGSTAAQGTLMGMGAGYKDYSVDTLYTIQLGGVGLSSGLCFQDIGNLPIAEGQINMTGLANGTYTLELVPGKGNNALWIDSTLGTCDSGSSGAFAVPVPTGNIVAQPVHIERAAVIPPVLTAAGSMMTHGAAGSFALPIALAGSASVECRAGGVQQVVMTYDTAMTGTPAVTLTATGGAAPTLGAVTLVGNTLTINMSGAVDKTCVTVAVSGITAGGLEPDQKSIMITNRYCDVDGNHAVQAADVSAVKGRTGLANVNATNFWYDVDVNGKIQAADVSQVKSKTALGATACTY